jgi:hypothetical protein
VRTYGWTFANRGLPIPGPAPYVRLTHLIHAAGCDHNMTI